MLFFIKISFFIFLSCPSFSIASAVTKEESEEVYEIRSAFVSRYTCYIEIQKKDIPKSGFLVAVFCEKYIKRQYSIFHDIKMLSHSLYGFPFQEIDLSQDVFFQQAVIFRLHEELDVENSLYGRLIRSAMLRLLGG